MQIVSSVHVRHENIDVNRLLKTARHRWYYNEQPLVSNPTAATIIQLCRIQDDRV
jgi:hypothetical protein